MKAVLLASLLISLTVFSANTPPQGDNVNRVKELKDFIRKEKPLFEARETVRKDALDDLDRLNSTQNKVRERLMSISKSRSELSMAIENLNVEHLKQKELEALQRKRLLLLLKVVYRVKRDGVLRFVMDGQNLNSLAGRVRIVYHTLRSHSLITEQLRERSERLAQSELQLSKSKQELDQVLADLHEQEDLLEKLLRKKRNLVESVERKQDAYQVAVREYKRVSKQLATMFNAFESHREPQEEVPFPSGGSLSIPVAGRVLKGFGKTIHPKFGTVTWHKGIEIEAPQGTPVVSVLPGNVEYSGWVRGMGNVVILHHGGGFYSLNGYLFKTSKPVGARVEQGEEIGLVGDTGSSDQPSLYFEFRENGKAVNPIRYFSKNALASLN